MPDLFSPSTRTQSAASNRFLVSAPAKHSFGDFIADDVGKTLATIGLSQIPRKPTSADAVNAQRMEAETRKAEGWAQLGQMASQLTPENAMDLYFQALPIAATHGIDTKDVNTFFKSAANSRSAPGGVMGRFSNADTFSDNSYFTPEDVTAAQAAAEERRLREHQWGLDKDAAAVAEAQRKEGVTAGAATLSHERGIEMENLKHDLLLDKPPTAPAPMPATAYDDLRKAVVTSLSDKVGQLPTKEGDLPSAITADPDTVSKITARAGELMSGPKALGAPQAIEQAIGELVQPEMNADLGPSFSMLGLEFGKKTGPKLTPKKADPLGLFGGK